MALEDKYVYTPLHVDPTGEQMSLRFVLLQPGTGTEEIHCSLMHHTFIERPQWRKRPVQYEALSYMWGPPTPLRHIILEGKVFPIRENLYWALIHLRLRDEERMIWVDGICINQEDNAEKDVQVAQMRLLYQGATKVTVWLGLENLELETNAFDVIKRIANRETHDKEWWRKLYDEFKATDDSKKPEWVAIKTFCELEYWSRIWIVQEVVLGYEVFIHWGNGEMQWRELGDLLDRVSAIEEDPDFGVQIRPWTELLTASIPYRLCGQKFGGGKAMSYGLFTAYEALGTYEESGCYDIRDKVFGMVGISRSKIPVNYSASALEICGQVMNDAVYGEGARIYTQPQNLVIMGEYVHKILCGPEITPKAALESGQKHQGILQAPIEVFSNISGSIVYLTDTLDKYQGHTHSSLESALEGTLKMVRDRPGLRRQLVYLNVLVKANLDAILMAFKNPTLNRAWKIPKTTSYGQEPPPNTEFKAWKVDETVKQAQKESRQSSLEALKKFHDTFPAPSETLASLILMACENLPPMLLQETKLFFSVGGLVGFASANVVLGDMVCTFMKSQTLAIIRQSAEESSFNVVSLASSYSRDADKIASISKPTQGGMMEDGNIPDRVLRFYFDLGTFQALCCFNRQAAKFIGYQKNRSSQVRRRLNPYAYR